MYIEESKELFVTIKAPKLPENVSEETVFDEVWKREELLPTGIENYLAIPHAKIDIKKPIAVVALNRQGLDFESTDSEPSRIIILLLTPQNDSELQLKLLAEIANLFGSKSNSEEVINSESSEQVFAKITKIKSRME